MAFSPKVQAFVDCYCGSIKDAAEAAGLTPGYCRQLMMRPEVKDAIQERQEKNPPPVPESVKYGLRNREERQQYWRDVSNDESVPIQHRLRASELLARSEGDFFERREEENDGFVLTLNFGEVMKAREAAAKAKQAGQ